MGDDEGDWEEGLLHLDIELHRGSNWTALFSAL
jgi:hypothetical protein